jgi:hypothetical protein
VNFNRIAFLPPLAIDKKTLRADGSRGHLSHGAILDLRSERNGK